MAVDLQTVSLSGAAAFERYHGKDWSDVPTRDDYAEVPTRTESNACPECEDGVTVFTHTEYGRDMFECDSCDWSS